jgi:quercetin dioxygenase-like cupin family protein
MTNYTRVNLMDVEDSVGGRAEGLEGRFARGPMGSKDIGVSHWRYAPGFRNSTGHSHREQEEAYLVISGSGEMLLDGDVIELAQWDLVRVAPTTVRALAAGPDGMEVIAVGGPKPDGGDGETSEANWPDA